MTGKNWKCNKCKNQCEIKSDSDPNSFMNCVKDYTDFKQDKKADVQNKPTNYQAPKEPELMTLQEALNKMDIGDKFLIDDPAWVEIEMFKGENGLRQFRTINDSLTVKISVEIMNKKGEIIPAEPKVLTAEEWIIEKFGNDSDYQKKDFIFSFNGGEKNQWLNHKELRKAAEEFVKHYPKSNYPSFASALANLKLLE